MPVTRTQQQTLLLKEGEIFLRVDGEGILEVGEIFSPVRGGIAGEFTKFKFNEKLKKVLRFEFRPPQRRTTFKLNDLTVSLPPVYLELFAEEGAKIGLEAGWVVQLITGSGITLSESAIVGTTQRRKVEGEKSLVVEFAPISRQVQLQEQVDVTPGTTFELVAYPFFRIVEAEKSKIIALTVTTENPFLKAGSKQAAAIVVYEQELQQ